MNVVGGQDMPPIGGFPNIQYKRHLPNRGPSGMVWLIGGTAMVIFGGIMYAYGQRIFMYAIEYVTAENLSIIIFRELEREKRQTRLMLIPFLYAEGDTKRLAAMEERARINQKLAAVIPNADTILLPAKYELLNKDYLLKSMDLL